MRIFRVFRRMFLFTNTNVFFLQKKKEQLQFLRTQNKEQNETIKELKERIETLEFETKKNEKKLEIIKYPRIGNLKDLLVVDTNLSHKKILDTHGAAQSIHIYCNACCKYPILTGKTFSKGKLIDINMRGAELKSLYQRWKEHVISGTHLHNQSLNHPIQMNIWMCLNRIAYGTIRAGDADSRYSNEIQRTIKNVGTDKSMFYVGNQHHSSQYVRKVEPIMAQVIQQQLTKKLTKIKPSTNV